MAEYRLYFYLIFLLSADIHAEQEKTNEEPDAAFIEFLGEWETARGNWVDPLELDSITTASCSSNQENCDE